MRKKNVPTLCSHEGRILIRLNRRILTEELNQYQYIWAKGWYVAKPGSVCVHACNMSSTKGWRKRDAALQIEDDYLHTCTCCILSKTCRCLFRTWMKINLGGGPNIPASGRRRLKEFSTASVKWSDDRFPRAALTQVYTVHKRPQYLLSQQDRDYLTTYV